VSQSPGEAAHVRRAGEPAADAHEWGTIAWLFAGSNADGALTFGHVEIAPGRKNPRHLHPNTDEVLYLLEGSLQHSLGEEVFELGPGDAIYITAGTPHDALNDGAVTARMLVAYGTGTREMVLCD
jgi:quercetin dioxygenase-like cupin family protein